MKFFKKFIFLFSLFVFIDQTVLFSYVKNLDLMDKNNKKVFLYRSIFYPGLGQFYIGNKSKGVAFFSFATLFISGAICSYSDSEKKYKTYLNSSAYSRDRYYKYKDYSRTRDQMFVFLGLTLLTWGYNILDLSCSLKNINNKAIDGIGLTFDIDNKESIITYSKIY